MIFHELTDARRAVHMRDDFEEEVRFSERGPHAREVGGSVLVAHGTRRDADRPVVQRADKGIRLRSERWVGELLGKAPQLASAGDRRMVVEKHAVGVAALAASEGDRDDLPAFGVVAKAGRVRHANELEFDQRLAHLKRLRHKVAQFLRIGDDQILPVAEAIWAGREGRAGQGHGECARPDGILVHV